MLGSHNSGTYIKSTRSFWMRPFAWMARCQSKDVLEQYDSGVRVFDFRIRCTGKLVDGVPEVYICHGLVEYGIPDILYTIISELNWYSKTRREKIWITVVYEDTFGKDKGKELFPTLYRHLQSTYLGIDFQFIDSKKTWNVVKDFQEPGWTNVEAKFWKFSYSCPLPFPWLWRSCRNTKNEKNGTLYYYDFV